MAYAYTPLGGRNIETPEERANRAIAAQNALAATQAARFGAAQQASATAADIMRQDAFSRQVAADAAAATKAQAIAAAALQQQQFAREMQERGWEREDIVGERERKLQMEALARFRGQPTAPAPTPGAPGAAMPGAGPAPAGQPAPVGPGGITIGQRPELDLLGLQELQIAGADPKFAAMQIEQQQRDWDQKAALARGRVQEVVQMLQQRPGEQPQNAKRARDLQSALDTTIAGKGDLAQVWSRARAVEEEVRAEDEMREEANAAHAAFVKELPTYLQQDYSFGRSDPGDADMDRLIGHLKSVARFMEQTGESKKTVAEQIKKLIEQNMAYGGKRNYYLASPSSDEFDRFLARVKKLFGVDIK